MKKHPFLNYAPRHDDILWERGIAPRILNLYTRYMWSASRPRRFTPGERAPVSIG